MESDMKPPPPDGGKAEGEAPHGVPGAMRSHGCRTWNLGTDTNPHTQTPTKHVSCMEPRVLPPPRAEDPVGCTDAVVYSSIFMIKTKTNP